MTKHQIWLFGICVAFAACKADQLDIGEDSTIDAASEVEAGALGSGGASTLGSGGSAVLETGGTSVTGTGGTSVLGSGGASGATGGVPGVGGSRPPRFESCGNGVIDRDEQCDDGNAVAFDGCNALCQVEADYACPRPGAPCILEARCGDGKVASSEACDDGNAASGDGCSADCETVERGWFCPAPGQRCQPRCGDGLLVDGEQCDDGNLVSEDGCSSTCRVEPGFSCPGAGRACARSICGNGVVEAGEACDCGAEAARLPAGCPGENGVFFGTGTGCSSTCTREPTCTDANGKTQACSASCGDGNLTAGEECDDGNLTDGDGCSSRCRLEEGFGCSSSAASDSRPCSTGGGQCLRIPVQYRDFQPENAAAGGHPDFFFLGSRYAGSTSSTTICVPNAAGPSHGNDSTRRCWGIAADTLFRGKPRAGATTTCECQFSDWSIANSGRIPRGYSAAGGDSPLSDGRGGFLGGTPGSPVTVTGAAGTSTGTVIGLTSSSPGGEIFRGTVPAFKNATSFAQWFNDDPTVNSTFASVLELKAIGSGAFQYASQTHLAAGGFFPLDGQNPLQATLCNLWPYWNHGDGTPIWATCSGDQYYLPPRVTSADCGGAAEDGCWVTGVTGVKHDSYFTFEARYHVAYDAATGLSLGLYGDDDLFVFINGVLVLDLGGVHQSLPGRVTVTGSPGDAQSIEGGCLDSAGNIAGASEGSTACNPRNVAVPAASGDDFRTRTVKLGLETGRTYEIAIFGADRHPPESNLQLTLTGSNSVRSQCQPTCGDGVVVAGEECDAGPLNDDLSYGGCTNACRLGPYCGDGIRNGAEECDLGAENGSARAGADGCTLACTRPHFCGDGIADGAMGEECDLGAQNGTAGSRCALDCRVLPL